MTGRSFDALVALLLLLVALALAGGCAGSGSGPSSAPEPAVSAAPFYFLADLVTGKVTALAAEDPRVAPAGTVSPQLVGVNTGAGSALEVTSSDLFSYTGTPGWRAVSMAITNHTAIPVGALVGGTETGLDLIFTLLTFRAAGGAVLGGGAVATADRYDPNGGRPIVHYPNALETGATATKTVAFQVPYPATQVIWGVIVRTDSPVAGAAPRLGRHCYVTTVAGTGGYGHVDGAAHLAQFRRPTGLHVESNGNVLVADCYNEALREVTTAGRVRTIPLPGEGIGSPMDVTVDEINSEPTRQIVYVATYNAGGLIRRVVRNPLTNETASVTTIAGNGPDVTGVLGSALALGSTRGIDCDPSGAFWVADPVNLRVVKLRPRDGADPFTAGADQYEVVTNLNKAGWSPEDCAVDDHGVVFMLNVANDRVERRDTTGRYTYLPLPALVHGGLTVDPTGTLCYVKSATNNHVYRYRQTGEDPALVGSWTLEEITTGGTGYHDGDGTVAQFVFGTNDGGLALDGAGSLFVTDGANDQIRRIDRLAGE